MLEKETVAESIKVVEPKNIVTWVRKGRCQPKKCGAWCCNTAMGVMGPKLGKSDYSKYGSFYEFFGFKEHKVKVNKENVLVAIPRLSCRYLGIDLKCRIHNKGKPRTCVDFPSTPTQEYFKIAKKAGCTFYFVKQRKVKK